MRLEILEKEGTVERLDQKEILMELQTMKKQLEAGKPQSIEQKHKVENFKALLNELIDQLALKIESNEHEGDGDGNEIVIKKLRKLKDEFRILQGETEQEHMIAEANKGREESAQFVLNNANSMMKDRFGVSTNIFG